MEQTYWVIFPNKNNNNNNNNNKNNYNSKNNYNNNSNNNNNNYPVEIELSRLITQDQVESNLVCNQTHQ